MQKSCIHFVKTLKRYTQTFANMDGRIVMAWFLLMATKTGNILLSSEGVFGCDCRVVVSDKKLMNGSVCVNN